MHLHRLDGCRPVPLANYLKALGVLRLISEQADSTVRGWWRDNVFHISTVLDRPALDSFFLNDWQPTPLLDPWSGGCGFYPKDNKIGIDGLIGSSAERFAPYRNAIATVRSVLSELKIEEKPAKGEQKNAVIAACRNAMRAGDRDWIDAALTLDHSGDPAFPAMLGTGGNDGRLDFTQNFMQRLVSLFQMQDPNGAPFEESASQLREALMGTPAPHLESGAIGQFLPGAAGGPNGTSGFDGGVSVNPWDFVLMLEGAIVFRAGVARKCQSNSMPQASAPFAVRSSGVGYGSADDADEGARGEQWLPLWNHPSQLSEVQALFLEGRAGIGRTSPERGTDMAMAAARLGVARGISSFERIGYIERNGLSNLAVPLGRFQVTSRPDQDLLNNELVGWIDHLRRIAGHKTAPASMVRVLRSCETALLNCTTNPGGGAFLNLLMCLGRAEDQFVRSPRFSADRYARPLPQLPHRWVDVIDHEVSGAEWRLAQSLAFQTGPLEKQKPDRSVRHHWLPLSENGERFATSESGLAFTPDQSAVGKDLMRALQAVLERRLIAAVGQSDRFIPMTLTSSRYGAEPEDLQAFLEGRVDDARILAIARGLMAVTASNQPEREQNKDDRDATTGSPLAGLALYGTLRLALPVRKTFIPFRGSLEMRCHPAVLRRLLNGDLAGSLRLAVRHLSAVGLRPRIQLGAGNAQLARRLAAAMAFGLSPALETRLALGLTNPEMSLMEQRAYQDSGVAGN